jgi:hypothetical protein
MLQSGCARVNDPAGSAGQVPGCTIVARESSGGIPGGKAFTGPADFLVRYLPRLKRDIRTPLTAASYGAQVMASLGEGLDG